MITITLNKIKEHNPCESGWDRVLAAKEHLGMDTPFPVSHILDTNDLDDTLWALRCLPEYDSLWRRYAVWCARQTEHLMENERSRDALDVAERFACGEASSGELAAAQTAAWDAARAAARDAAGVNAWAAAWDAAWDAARAAARDAAGVNAWAAARTAQEEKLRSILDAGCWVDDNTTEENTK